MKVVEWLTSWKLATEGERVESGTRSTVLMIEKLAGGCMRSNLLLNCSGRSNYTDMRLNYESLIWQNDIDRYTYTYR